MLEPVTSFQVLNANHHKDLQQTIHNLNNQRFNWRPHQEAKSINEILGYLHWFEDWLTDAFKETGRYQEDTYPRAYRVSNLNEFIKAFDETRVRCSDAYACLKEDSLRHELDYFGQKVSVYRLLQKHVGLLSGSLYQIEYLEALYKQMHGNSLMFERWCV